MPAFRCWPCVCVEAPQPDGRRLTRSRPCDANGGVKIGASRHRLPAPRAGLGAGQDSAGTREALQFSALGRNSADFVAQGAGGGVSVGGGALLRWANNFDVHTGLACEREREPPAPKVTVG